MIVTRRAWSLGSAASEESSGLNNDDDDDDDDNNGNDDNMTIIIGVVSKGMVLTNMLLQVVSVSQQCCLPCGFKRHIVF